MENSNILDTAPCTFETSSSSENQEDKLKVKRSIHLPDEIWLKIFAPVAGLGAKKIFSSDHPEKKICLYIGKGINGKF